MKSVVCCTKKTSFATINLAKQSKMIHITLVGSPCCDNEFKSFIQLLDTIIATIKPLIGEYVLLYDISNCSFNSKYMKEQESRLDQIQTCAIVTKDMIIRKIISVMINRKRKSKSSNVIILSDKVKALQWLLSHRL